MSRIKFRLFVSILLLSLLLPLGLGVAGAAPLSAGETVYTVQKDDNLWSLAEKYLGNGTAYTAIVAATNAVNAQDSTFAKIANPSIIQPGWKVLIPAPEDAGALMASYKPPEPEKLILATTTSTENSGLLAHILPDFEVPAEFTKEGYLEHLCREGIEKRYGKMTPQLEERLKTELCHQWQGTGGVFSHRLGFHKTCQK